MTQEFCPFGSGIFRIPPSPGTSGEASTANLVDPGELLQREVGFIPAPALNLLRPSCQRCCFECWAPASAASSVTLGGADSL